MKDNNSADLDVTQLYIQFKRSVRKGVFLAFEGLNFIIRKWRIIVLLIIIGFAAGYFKNSSSKSAQKATALLKVNFDAVNYVYGEVETINEKIQEGDSIFFSKIGLRADSLEISELKITPLVNLKDLGQTYRNVDGLIKNVEFDKSEIEVAETFISEYKNHRLDFLLSSSATPKTIDKIIQYLNSDLLLRQLRDTTIENMKRRVIRNEEIVRQIDKVIESYTNSQSDNAGGIPMIVVDKNFDISALLNKKTDLTAKTEIAKERLIVSQDIVVITNNVSLIKVKSGIAGKEIIFYPIIVVFIFLFLAWFRYIFFYLKQIAEDTNQLHQESKL